MDKYPNYLLYASAEEVKSRMSEHNQLRSLREKEEMLYRCEEIEIEEINGELKYAVDLDVFHFLMNLLEDIVEKERKNQ